MSNTLTKKLLKPLMKLHRFVDREIFNLVILNKADLHAPPKRSI